jgi:hypothetical protein
MYIYSSSDKTSKGAYTLAIDGDAVSVSISGNIPDTLKVGVDCSTMKYAYRIKYFFTSSFS